MFPSVDERVDRLESIFEQFMAQTSTAITHLDMTIARIDRSLEDFKKQSEKSLSRLEQNAEQDRREHNKRWGELANKMGTLIEDIVAPNLRRMTQAELSCGEFQHFAIRLERVHPLTKQEREFDVVAAGSVAVLLNETKSAPTPEHAQAFAKFVESGEFFNYFPEYKGRALLPVFSSLYIPANVVTYLTKQGVYAVAMSGDTMQVLNLSQVKGTK